MLGVCVCTDFTEDGKTVLSFSAGTRSIVSLAAASQLTLIRSLSDRNNKLSPMPVGKDSLKSKLVGCITTSFCVASVLPVGHFWGRGIYQEQAAGPPGQGFGVGRCHWPAPRTRP